MRLAGIIVGIILVLLGLVWVLQGSNVIGGSVMSGQSMWLWIGVVVAIVGLVLLLWSWTRRV
jgi:hypothetical protein